MITVTYDPNFKGCVPDGRVKEIVDNIITFKDQKFKTIVSNESVIEELQTRVRTGKLNHKDIVFRFKEKDIFVTKDGNFVTEIL